LKKDILISIVIPVKNGDYWLEDTLTSIEKQTLFPCTEIIAIDSGSTDLSLDILKKHAVRVIQIAPATFNHGLTRNLGVEAARGEFIVMTVQDAKPADEFWLQHLMHGFENDANVAGVCGQQIVPHDLDKNPIEWFRPQSPPGIKKFYFSDPNEFESLAPSEKRRACGWDNVTAMYRRSVLLEIPFKETNFAEDALWAKDALLKGYSIVYNNVARVYHYHLNEPDYVLRRSYTVYYHFFLYFGFKPTEVQNGLTSLLRNAKVLIFEKELSVADKLKWFIYNWKLRKSINHSVALFLKHCKLGKEGLLQKHNEICKTVPAAIKPKSLNK
jgi:rhamnosyltransferase